MKISALKSFVCPLDNLPLIQKNNIFQCEKNHVFDAAREGYCNLLLVQHKASLDPGDNREMVASRQRFLDGGYFLPIAKRLFEIVLTISFQRMNQDTSFRMVDAGCGEGFYLYQLRKLAMASHHPDHWALAGCDISKWAVKAAAKRSTDIAWAVAGNRRVPFASGTIDLVLSMFGYPDWESFKAVQPGDGQVLLVDPGPNHLIELRQMIYPKVNDHDERSLDAAKNCGYMLKFQDQIQFSMNLEKQSAIQDLLAMTPHAFRITPKARDKLRTLKCLTVSVDVIFRILKKS